MMLISKFGAAKQEDILKVCSNMPEDLKIFLEKYNGGETPETSFSINGISSNIVAFYGVGDVKYSYSNLDLAEFSNSDYLPVAFDSFGNQMVISLRDGSISFSDHEKNNLMTKIADSLKQFFSLVNSKEIEPKHLKPVAQREAELISRGRGNNISDTLRELWQKEIDKYSVFHQETVEI